MILPSVAEPQRYCGLYVYDFGQWSAIGYTAEEIAVLLEDEQTRGGQVYRIHRAAPDGTMELAGVSAERFGLESGMFFYRTDEGAARADYERLAGFGENGEAFERGGGAPCRARLELADRRANAELYRYVVSLVYPAEYDEDVSAWLIEVDYQGGDVVEGGISPVAEYLREDKVILERTQLWGRASVSSRTASEVLASTRRAVQR